MHTNVQVMDNTITLHTLNEINKPGWLSKYWQILCSANPSDEIEKAKLAIGLPLFLRTNTFKDKAPENGRHEIEVGKLVFVPVSVSEFDIVEERYFNLGKITSSAERLGYARAEYELAIDKPKLLSINGHRVLDRESIYGPYYTEVKEFSLKVDAKSPLFRDFDIPYSDKDLDQELKASIIGHCVVVELPEGKFTVSSYSEGPFGEWTAGNHIIEVGPKK